MAIIHVSEAEAARDLSTLFAKVRAGDEVRINSGADSFSLVPSSAPKTEVWTISEAIRRAQEHRSDVLLDDQFGDDVEAGIRSHEHEVLRDPWQE